MLKHIQDELMRDYFSVYDDFKGCELLVDPVAENTGVLIAKYSGDLLGLRTVAQHINKEFSNRFLGMVGKAIAAKNDLESKVIVIIYPDDSPMYA